MKRRDQMRQIAGAGAADLQKQSAMLREKLWNLREELVSGKVKNVREMRALKQSLARILTRLGTLSK